jgi:hypothetical protein
MQDLNSVIMAPVCQAYVKEFTKRRSDRVEEFLPAPGGTPRHVVFARHMVFELRHAA